MILPLSPTAGILPAQPPLGDGVHSGRLVTDSHVVAFSREVWHGDPVLLLFPTVLGGAEPGDIPDHLHVGFAPDLTHQVQDYQQHFRVHSIQRHG